MRVGRVIAVYWAGDATLATALAELADRPAQWPGLPATDSLPIRLVVTRSRERFDSVTGRRLPPWSTAVAFPRSGSIVLRVSGDPLTTLRHELAHLALYRATRAQIPLWFDEGYAARAAAEWGRLDALAVNWALAKGNIPSFARLNRELRSGPAHARAAYALSTAAVLFLERLGGERGLAPLLENLQDVRSFDQAVRRTHLVSLAQLEGLWQRELRSRYGWLRIFTSFAVFWTVIVVVVGVLWWRRRRYDQLRRARLDDGWVLPPNAPSTDA